jgi:uncharacterized protein YqgC (DUF456 family)
VDVLLLVAGLVVILVGLVSQVVPGLPGSLIIYGGIVLVAWADDFARIGPVALVLLAALAVVASIADNIAGLFGARLAGASGWGVFGAGCGVLVGLPFGLPGIILGPAVGALAFEYLRNQDLKRAGKAGLGGLFGYVLGVVAKYSFSAMLVGVAALAYLF